MCVVEVSMVIYIRLVRKKKPEKPAAISHIKNMLQKAREQINWRATLRES